MLKQTIFKTISATVKSCSLTQTNQILIKSVSSLDLDAAVD